MAQKTLLQIAQAVTAELGFPTPQIVVSSADTNVLKLLALIRATCDDLLHEHDWQELQKRYTFATTNGVDNYALPSDEERFMSASFYDQNNRWPMLGPLTAVEWEQIKVSNLSASPFERYRVMGDKLYLSPTPGANTSTFVYEYISNAYCTSSAGVPQTDLQQDSDIIVFDHRAVVYGVKAKWLASVNMDTTKADEDYARALEYAKSTNEPARRLNITGAGAGVPLLSTLNIPDTGFGGAY
jgi:hypothetical protein